MLALIFPLLALGVSGQLLWAESSHCPKSCFSCPAGVPARDMCLVSPALMQFSCMCIMHHALCNGFAQNVVFYQGKCSSNPYYHLDNTEVTLFTFRGTDSVPLRDSTQSTLPKQRIFHPHPSSAFKKLKYFSPSELEAPDDVPQKLVRLHRKPLEKDLLVDQEEGPRAIETPKSSTQRSTRRHVKPQLDKAEKCKLFYDQDRKFQRSNRNSHFECITADQTKTEKIPIESSSS